MLGVVGAVAAQTFAFLLRVAERVFLQGLAHYHAPGLPEEGGALTATAGAYGLWLIPVATALGGLLSGLLVYQWAPEAEGHGTDTAVRAFHYRRGFIRARVPFLKLIASALTIGSGGAAGREGPVALIASGFGSLYAIWRRRSVADRRLLVLAGMSAGLSAIFRSPIGAALFAVEVLYGETEFEAAGLLYAMLASVVAYAINALIVGWHPLFQFPSELSVGSLSGYGWHCVLGLASGCVAALIPSSLYLIRDGFQKLPGPEHVRPAVGGLGVGLIALGLPQVLGGGYGWIQEVIDGRIVGLTLVVLLFAKLLAFSLTIGSGGSGGVFAPSLFVGATLGGILAQLTHHAPAGFVVVGMAAVFGAAARVPIASLFMVTEMTGGYHMLVPAALAVTLSYVSQVIISSRLPYRSLYEAQVLRRADSPAHYEEHLRSAFDLLERVPSLSKVGRIALVPLLASGVPVDLPDEKQFRLVRPKDDSPCLDQPIECLAGGDFEVIGVLRQDGLFLPETGMELKADDRLLVICSRKSWEAEENHMEPVTRENAT